MKKCKKCGEYYFEKNMFDKINYSHSCKKYKIYYESYYGDKPLIYYGCNIEDVVEKFAREFNEYDSPVVDQDIFDGPIKVIDPEGNDHFFECYAEHDIRYNVNEVSNK